jgi:hypothetical protein
MELRAYISYKRLDHELCFWATYDGTEVDFVIPDILAVEVKATTTVRDRDTRSLQVLMNERPIQQRLLVSLDPTAAVHAGVRALPVTQFVKELWAGQLL